jgi:hypothetical protein
MANYDMLSKGGWEPRGRAFTTYLKHTGQIDSDTKRVKAELTKEERTARIMNIRKQWDSVLRQLPGYRSSY